MSDLIHSSRVGGSQLVVSFFGPPGSGKGTLAKKVRERLGFPIFSTGESFREAMKSNTETGEMVRKYMEAGQLVPTPVVLSVVASWLRKQFLAGNRALILDGFPRTYTQAAGLKEMLASDFSELIGGYLYIVVNFLIRDELVRRRILGRLICSNPSCQQPHRADILHETMDYRCRKCGSPLMKRPDDTDEVFSKRLKEYHAEFEKIMAVVFNDGFAPWDLFIEIDINDLDEEEVYDRFIATLNLCPNLFS
jgi:adenylate kinase